MYVDNFTGKNKQRTPPPQKKKHPTKPNTNTNKQPDRTAHSRS